MFTIQPLRLLDPALEQFALVGTFHWSRFMNPQSALPRVLLSYQKAQVSPITAPSGTLHTPWSWPDSSTIGTASYFLGKTASGLLGAIGFVGVGIAVVVFLIARRRELIRRRAGAKRRSPSGANRRMS